MKACVFSDSHGFSGNMIKAVNIEKPDAVFFLGDGERDIAELDVKFPDLEIWAVRGNCDFVSKLASADCRTFEGVTVYATHGHLSDVKYDPRLEMLTSQAAEAGADIALFGHTHRQHMSESRGVTLINPGECGRGWYPGYAVLILDNGRFSAELKTI